MATIKIVGFKVGEDRSTCYYKVPDVPFGAFEAIAVKGDSQEEKDKEVEKVLGHYLYLALKKSDYVSIRK